MLAVKGICGAISRTLKSSRLGKTIGIRVVEDFCRLLKSDACNSHIGGLGMRVFPSHDEQIECKICNSAVGVDTSIVGGASESTWVPVIVASTRRVIHISKCVAVAIGCVNVFSEFPNILSGRTHFSINKGAKDIGPCLVEG
jgi:hypothetical protein